MRCYDFLPLNAYQMRNLAKPVGKNGVLYFTVSHQSIISRLSYCS